MALGPRPNSPGRVRRGLLRPASPTSGAHRGFFFPPQTTYLSTLYLVRPDAQRKIPFATLAATCSLRIPFFPPSPRRQTARTHIEGSILPHFTPFHSTAASHHGRPRQTHPLRLHQAPPHPDPQQPLLHPPLQLPRRAHRRRLPQLHPPPRRR